MIVLDISWSCYNEALSCLNTKSSSERETDQTSLFKCAGVKLDCTVVS